VKYSYYIFCLLWILYFLSVDSKICSLLGFLPHYPFDVAMQRISYLEAISDTERITQIDGVSLYKFLKMLYETYNPSTLTPSTTIKIPKIIHQIWLGSPVPDVYKTLMQTWVDMHPGWEYRLWTDENVGNISLFNKKFYDEAQNYGMKSDILRWEILYQYGGLYVDVDYQCLQPFDALHYLYDFYTGIQPLDTLMVQLGAALVGTCPQHPILKHCIETIGDHWKLKGAPQKTGPIHFTRSFYAQAGQHGTIDIALPPVYVYPLGCREKVTATSVTEWLQKGALAVHWWSKSWMPMEYRPLRFRSIENSQSSACWND
jgi:mannosyltransferase OCH1-like enzyme